MTFVLSFISSENHYWSVWGQVMRSPWCESRCSHQQGSRGHQSRLHYSKMCLFRDFCYSHLYHASSSSRNKTGIYSQQGMKSFLQKSVYSKSISCQRSTSHQKKFHYIIFFQVYIQKVRKGHAVLLVDYIQTFTACLGLFQLRKLHKVFSIKCHLSLTCSDKIELW